MAAAMVFGLAAAVFVTSSLLAASRAVHLIGNFSALAWVALIGFLVTGPWAIVSGVPEFTSSQLIMFAAIGATGIGGFVFSFAALRIGKVGVVAPILATEGAVAAVVSALMGEQIAVAAAGMLAVSVLGVVVAGAARDPFPRPGERPVLAVGLAVGAAATWGVGIYVIGRLATELPVPWVILPTRLMGTICLAVPLLLLRRLRITRRALPLVIVAGLSEVILNVFIALGARSSIAITGVLAAQYAVLTPLAAWLLFKESLNRQQVIGIILLVVGVSGLALVGL